MKKIAAIAVLGFLFSCKENRKQNQEPENIPLTGTWKLLVGTVIEKSDTTITDYTKDKSFIKIINDSPFSFLLHNLMEGKDSATAVFTAGGGLNKNTLII